jgi:hypothetical protein
MILMSHKIVWLLFLCSLMACNPIQKIPPPPSPFPFHVEIPITLKPAYQERVEYCSRTVAELAIFLEVVPDAAVSLENSDMIVRMGESKGGIPGYAAQIGWEQILVITNSDVETNNLTVSQIREIFTATPPPLKIWTYPENYEIKRFFEESILGDLDISSYALVAANPGEMLEAIGSEPGSMGYIPKSWLIDDVQVISIDQTYQDFMTYPVLVFTNQEPEGSVKQFLVCLQSYWMQGELTLENE